MSKLIEAHRLIAKAYELKRDGHALLAEYHAEVPSDASAPSKEKKTKKVSEPALPAVAAAPETPAAPVTAGLPDRDVIRDKFRDFIKSSVDNTAKAKQLLSQYGVAKFGEIADDKLAAFAASLEAVASPAASDTMI